MTGVESLTTTLLEEFCNLALKNQGEFVERKKTGRMSAGL